MVRRAMPKTTEVAPVEYKEEDYHDLRGLTGQPVAGTRGPADVRGEARSELAVSVSLNTRPRTSGTLNTWK